MSKDIERCNPEEIAMIQDIMNAPDPMDVDLTNEPLAVGDLVQYQHIPDGFVFITPKGICCDDQGRQLDRVTSALSLAGLIIQDDSGAWRDNCRGKADWTKREKIQWGLMSPDERKRKDWFFIDPATGKALKGRK